eukprot:17954-Heterococcus_DN1.PRE.1
MNQQALVIEELLTPRRRADEERLQHRRGANGAPLRQRREREEMGVLKVPGKIFATLQHKFWDSNALVTGKAVWARDALANCYLEGKQWTGMAAGAAAGKTLDVYKFARDRSTTVELPSPLIPVRDLILLPTFRGPLTFRIKLVNELHTKIRRNKSVDACASVHRAVESALPLKCTCTTCRDNDVNRTV